MASLKETAMASLKGDSADAAVPAVSGENTAGGAAVFGQAHGDGPAVFGQAEPNGRGVVGVSEAHAGVEGNTATGAGVWGSASGAGGRGVVGITTHRNAFGIFGENTAGGAAVFGQAHGDGPAVFGQAEPNGRGVVGVSEAHAGVEGNTATGAGVWGSASGAGGRGVVGIATHPNGRAGFFDGNVEVTGDLFLSGADVAEHFDVATPEDSTGEVTAGAVVVLDDTGSLRPCEREYDHAVAGVVSGAGDRLPALILDRQKQPESRWRRAVAVIGKVWCRADASAHPIRIGSLLTTSATPGHAMAAVDREAAFGAVLGKALTPLSAGTGLVLVLVGLG